MSSATSLNLSPINPDPIRRQSRRYRSARSGRTLPGFDGAGDTAWPTTAHMDLLGKARDLVPPLAVVETSEGILLVKARDENGFDVSFQRADGQWVISVGGWQGRFDDAEDALQCFEGALSSSAYLVIAYRGSRAVQTNVHWPSGMVSTSGSLLSPFWRTKSAAIRRNDWPAVQDAAED